MDALYAARRAAAFAVVLSLACLPIIVENGLGVRVVQSRHGLEGLIRLLDSADPLEFGEVEGKRKLTEIKVTERAECVRR